MFFFYLFLLFLISLNSRLTLSFHSNWFRSTSTSNEVNSQNNNNNNPRSVEDIRRFPNVSSRRLAAGWRPKASDDLPVAALLENPDTKNDPANADLDETNLRLLLNGIGNGVDPKFSSVTKPSIVYNGTIEFPFDTTKRSKILASLRRIPRHFRNLFKTNELPNGVHAKLHLKSQLKKRVYDYLWAYSYCPVKYTWKDLGIRFWPRWIKEGRCLNKRSCSIPPGMSCKQSSSKQVELLRWHCKTWQTAYYCTWIKVHYPILTSCTCSC